MSGAAGSGGPGVPVTRALPARRPEPTRHLPPSSPPAAAPGPQVPSAPAPAKKPWKTVRRRPAADAPPPPARPRKRRWYLRKRLVIPLGLLALIVLSNRGDSTKPAPGGSKVGAPVRDGNLEFVVSKVTCGVPQVGSGLVKRTAKGQYCLADVRVKNVKDDARTLYEPFEKLIDSAGDKHGADISMRLVLLDQTLWDKVEPGRQVSGTMVFDIPRDTKPEALELHDGPVSGGVTVRLP